MSAPLAGKFQDHYEVLGIEHKADPDTIERAFAKLTEKYRASNKDTGNSQKLEAIKLAHEVLTDPMLRSAFDKLKGYGNDEGIPKFSGQEFFDVLGRQANMRMTLLCILYDRRRCKPFTPSLSVRQLENMLNATGDEMNFATWYLKQRGLAASDDRSSLVITADGMDFLESHIPSAEVVMPLVRPVALPGYVAPPPEAETPAGAAPEIQPETPPAKPPEEIPAPPPAPTRAVQPGFSALGRALTQALDSKRGALATPHK